MFLSHFLNVSHVLSIIHLIWPIKQHMLMQSTALCQGLIWHQKKDARETVQIDLTQGLKFFNLY